MNTIKQSFKRWTPIDTLANNYDVDDIKWTDEGLCFSLISDSQEPDKDIPNKLRILWDSSLVIYYNVTDETYRADCWEIDFVKDGRFFISSDSEYLRLFKQKSPLFPDEAIHFLIVGTNTIVDVIAKSYPTVELTD